MMQVKDLKKHFKGVAEPSNPAINKVREEAPTNESVQSGGVSKDLML